MCYYSDTLKHSEISIISCDDYAFSSDPILLPSSTSLLDKYVPDDINRGHILLISAAHGCGKTFSTDTLMHYYEQNNYETVHFDLSSCAQENLLNFFIRLYNKFSKKNLLAHRYFVVFSHVYSHDEQVHEQLIRVASLLFNAHNRILIATRPQYLHFYRKLYPLAQLVNKSDLTAKMSNKSHEILQATHGIAALSCALLRDREHDCDIHAYKSSYLKALTSYMLFYINDYGKHCQSKDQNACQSYVPMLLLLFSLGSSRLAEVESICRKLNIDYNDIQKYTSLEDGFIEFNLYTSSFEVAGLCDDRLWQLVIKHLAQYFKNYPELIWVVASKLAQRGSYIRCATMLNLISEFISTSCDISSVSFLEDAYLKECIGILLERGYGLILSGQTNAVRFLLKTCEYAYAKTWSFQFLKQAYNLLTNEFLPEASKKKEDLLLKDMDKSNLVNEAHELKGACVAHTKGTCVAHTKGGSVAHTAKRDAEEAENLEQSSCCASSSADVAIPQTTLADTNPAFSATILQTAHKRIPYVTKKTKEYYAYMEVVRLLEYIREYSRFSLDEYKHLPRLSKSRAPLVYHIMQMVKQLVQGNFLKALHRASLQTHVSVPQTIFDVLECHTRYYAYVMLGLPPEGTLPSSSGEKSIFAFGKDSSLCTYISYCDELIAMLSKLKPVFSRGAEAIRCAQEHDNKTFEVIFYIADAINHLLQGNYRQALSRAQAGFSIATSFTGVSATYIQQVAYFIHICACLLAKEPIKTKGINCCEGFFQDLVSLVLYSLYASNWFDDRGSIPSHAVTLKPIVTVPSRNMSWIYALVYKLFPTCVSVLVQNTPLAWQKTFLQFMKTCFVDFSWDGPQTMVSMQSQFKQMDISLDKGLLTSDLQDNKVNLHSDLEPLHELQLFSCGKRVFIQCFNRFSVYVDGVAQDTRLLQKRHVNQLLGYLSLCPQHRSNRYNLITAIWGDCDFEYGMVRLYETMSAARKAMHAKELPQNPLRVNKNEGMIFLDDAVITCDVDIFARLSKSIVHEELNDEAVIDKGCRALTLFGSGIDVIINDLNGKFYGCCEEIQNLFATVSILVSNAACRQGRIRLALRVMQSAFSQMPLREDIVCYLLKLLETNDRASEIPHYLAMYKAQLHAVGVREIPRAIQQFTRLASRHTISCDSNSQNNCMTIKINQKDRLQN